MNSDPDFFQDLGHGGGGIFAPDQNRVNNIHLLIVWNEKLIWYFDVFQGNRNFFKNCEIQPWNYCVSEIKTERVNVYEESLKEQCDDEILSYPDRVSQACLLEIPDFMKFLYTELCWT